MGITYDGQSQQYGQPFRYSMDQWRFICFHSEDLRRAEEQRKAAQESK